MMFLASCLFCFDCQMSYSIWYQSVDSSKMFESAFCFYAVISLKSKVFSLLTYPPYLITCFCGQSPWSSHDRSPTRFLRSACVGSPFQSCSCQRPRCRSRSSCPRPPVGTPPVRNSGSCSPGRESVPGSCKGDARKRAGWNQVALSCVEIS